MTTFAEQILKEIKTIDTKIENCISRLKSLDAQLLKLDPNAQFENELTQKATPTSTPKQDVTQKSLDQHEKFIMEKPDKFAEMVYLRNKGVKAKEIATSFGVGHKQSVYSLFWAAKRLGYITNPSRGRYVVTDLFRELLPDNSQTILKAVN